MQELTLGQSVGNYPKQPLVIVKVERGQGSKSEGTTMGWGIAAGLKRRYGSLELSLDGCHIAGRLHSHDQHSGTFG